MKKLVVALALIVTVLCINKTQTIIIPKEAIRFRVIANSNEEKDQIIKKRVVLKLKENLKNILVVKKKKLYTRIQLIVQQISW